MTTDEIRVACRKKMSGRKMWPHKGRMTLRQVSAETKVSIACLSRFFNGNQARMETLVKLSEWVNQ